MTRRLLCLMGLLLAPTAHAHFIWVVPEGADATKAKVLFSDNLTPDKTYGKRQDRIAEAEFRLRDADGKESLLTLKKGDDTSGILEIPGKGNRVVGGKCLWGIHVLKERGEKTPFLLCYYPKAVLGDPSDSAASKPWNRLTAEIVATQEKDGLRVQVLYEGKPVPKARLTVLRPGETKIGSYTTNRKGEFRVTLEGAGNYAIWSMAGVEKKEGTHKGEKYEEVRHYASLVLNINLKK